MRISDWSSDVCSSDLLVRPGSASLPRFVNRPGSGCPVPAAAWGFNDEPVTCAQFDLVGVPKGLTGAIRALDPVSAGLARTSSEERRVGKECVRTCRSRWWPDH